MAEDEPIRLFIDEDVWLGLAAALRERGFDVIHAYEVARGSLKEKTGNRSPLPSNSGEPSSPTTSGITSRSSQNTAGRAKCITASW